MTMLARVAEAIARQMAEDDNDDVDLARAALQAIRDVDALPAWAGTIQYEQAKAEGWDSNLAAHAVFTAMIDAILAEGDKTP